MGFSALQEKKIMNCLEGEKHEGEKLYLWYPLEKNLPSNWNKMKGK